MVQTNWRIYIHVEKVYQDFLKQLRAFAATYFYKEDLKRKRYCLAKKVLNPFAKIITE